MERRVRVLALLAGLVATACSAARVDDEPSPESRVDLTETRITETGIPRVRAVRTDATIEIDGRLDEPAWQIAGVIDQFVQVEPDEGASPTELTEVRLLYDDDFLYIGVRAYDSEPAKIIAWELEPDRELDATDDTVSIVLDTFLDRRNAYFLQTNALGAKTDGLIENSSRPNTDWDGIWYVEGSIDNEGWVAEFAIPAKTVSFNPDGTAWGFNIERMIRRKNETARWSAFDLNKRLFEIGEAGIIENLVGLQQGLGLDVKPSGIVRHIRDHIEDHESTKVEPSLDIFYKVTPSLTTALTLNTDFAETEVDEREVNLTRFDLFFPEKRDFFLQDAGIFEFGGLERNGRPFFSRRIGLDEEDRPVDILAGVKLTGREGPWNIGLFVVQQETTGDEDADSETLAVGRLALNVLEQSSVGIIFTHGDPRSPQDNNVFGADFTYRDTRFFGDQVLGANLWVQRSFTEGLPDNDTYAYGARLDYPNEPLEFLLAFSEIQRNFRPGLGFANRRDIREYDGEINYQIYRQKGPPRGLLRTIDSGVEALVVTDIADNAIETEEVALNVIRLRNHPGDSIRFSYILAREVLDEEFEIVEDVIIPPGDYDFNRFAIELVTTESRPLSGSLRVDWGDFFTGTRLDLRPSIAWRPSPVLFISLEYQRSDVDLPQGDFTVHLARGRLNIRFSTDLAWTNLVQYDSVSDLVGINSRLRWTIDPGNELAVVLNQGFAEEAGQLNPTITEAVTKLTWTFRF
jgi:hypothetical protein